MKPRDLIFVGIVIVVVGGLYYLSTKNKAKAMSSRAEHMGVKAREDCMKCHTPAKFEELERVHKHPGKWRDARVSCLLCHTTPDGQKARKTLSIESVQLAGLDWRAK
ncbi:MAG TPA: hypothetical protein VGB07_34075 [Blastocatellia bacterium]|jgi:hypothetical protein